MAKKSLISILAIIVLSLCCGMCFAEEKSGSVNLGNEIMQSMDKTGDSAKNVISGNIVEDTANIVKDGVNNVGDTARDMGNSIENGMRNMTNKDNENDKNNDNRNNQNAGTYNATRTVGEAAQTAENGFASMTTTTWMWIILVVAAIIIIAAIWYYATQNNS